MQKSCNNKIGQRSRVRTLWSFQLANKCNKYLAINVKYFSRSTAHKTLIRAKSWKNFFWKLKSNTFAILLDILEDVVKISLCVKNFSHNMKIEQYIYFAILWLWVHKHFCLFYWVLPSFARLSEHREIRSINSLQNKTKCQSRWAGSTFSLRERNATSLRITDTLTKDKCANTQWARFMRKMP